MNIIHEYYDVIDSTNNEIKRRGAEGDVPEGLVISAGTQTAGRGRSGHEWESPVNVSVATSMALHPTVAMAHVPRLTLIAAMAVASAIEQTCDLKTEIKWPNDIIVNKKKVCGILTEMSASHNKIGYVVVGIGVNIHQQQNQYPPEIAAKAISLDQALAQAKEDPTLWIHPDRMHKTRAGRKEVTYAIWDNFARYYEQFQKTEDLSGILEEYNCRLVNRNRPVRIMDPKGAYEAVALEMDKTGALIVDVAGEQKSIDSGEVSVRGLLGYV